MCILIWQFRIKRSIVIQLLDFLILRIDQILITINNVEFNKFIKILREKTGYNLLKNIILYQYNKNKEVKIINKRL